MDEAHRLATSKSRAAAVVNDSTCGKCLEDSNDQLNLPCGHSFCDGCLDGWRSRYGVKEEMRRKCPICRASIPPSKEMVTTLIGCRATKKRLEDKNDTSSERYHALCRSLEEAEETVGADWDGVTVLQDTSGKPPPLIMQDDIVRAIGTGDIKSVLEWINANRAEDRVNATANAEATGVSALCVAAVFGQMELMTLLLQLGADIDIRGSQGTTTISLMFSRNAFVNGNVSERARLLLSWGANFFPDQGCTKKYCISRSRKHGEHKLAHLISPSSGEGGAR